MITLFELFHSFKFLNNKLYNFQKDSWVDEKFRNNRHQCISGKNLKISVQVLSVYMCLNFGVRILINSITFSCC